MTNHPDADTTGQAYTDRLAELGQARWKRLLDVQAPYRWNLRRLLGERRVLDVSCGIGRNLAHLGAGSVGVDHNRHSVRTCRDRGLTAFTSPSRPGWAGCSPTTSSSRWRIVDPRHRRIQRAPRGYSTLRNPAAPAECRMGHATPT
ncbi:MAG: hypothetical protein ACRDST_09810 [Pseudonocardiaceae bacterium]